METNNLYTGVGVNKCTLHGVTSSMVACK